MEKSIREFEKYLEIEKNFSPHTRTNYLIDLRQFMQFLEKNGIDFGSGQENFNIDPMLIRSFLGSLYQQGMKKVSISRKVASLRSFFRFLLRRGIRQIQPCGNGPGTPGRKIPARFSFR